MTRRLIAATALLVALTSCATTPAATIDLPDLPLIELPATAGGSAADAHVVAILLTGDGGWTGIDRAIAGKLQARGIAVVGWDSLRYFWTERTPETSARDLDRVIRHYARAWDRSRVLLVGYSQGADVLPFMVNRLPAATRALVSGIALVAVTTEATFEVTVSNWFGRPPPGRPVAPEIADARLGHATCIYGTDDRDAACGRIDAPTLRKVELPGGHHFDGDYAGVADAVSAVLPREAPEREVPQGSSE